MIKRGFYKLYEKLNNRDVLSKLDELEKNQWLSAAELNMIRNKQLFEIINLSVKKVPYYRRIKEKSDIEINYMNIVDTIEQFPILTKQDIINNYEALKNPNFKGRVYKNFSGGSTGTPVKLLQDQVRNDYNSAGTKRSDRWANFDFNSSLFQFWGAPRDTIVDYKEKMERFLLNRYMFDAFNWNENTIVHIHKLMEKVRPDIILAYSSALYFYVKTAKEKGLKPNHSPKGIIVSADMLYNYQREEIEEYFGTKVFNRYGCREVGLIACECEEHNGLHISSDRLYIEIVDENNRPVPKGETGKILITDLTNTAMPLLRYKIGDMGRLSLEKKCPCGRNLPKLESIEGRIAEYIVTKNGNHVRVPAYIVTRLNNVKQLQLVQNDYESLTVRVVKNSGYNSKDEINIINNLKEYIDDDMDYKFEYQDSLLNKTSGKFRFIINELPEKVPTKSDVYS